jgi:hypothetical protein
MKKSILIIVILSIAALCFAGPLQEMHKRVIAGSTVAGGEGGTAGCIDGATFSYNGDHASGTTYGCDSVGAGIAGTNNSLDSISSDYITFNANNENLTFAVDPGELDDSEGTICATVYIDAADPGDDLIWESVIDSENRIWGRIVGTNDTPNFYFEGQDTYATVYANAAITGQAWYRICYAWQTGADSGGTHSAKIQAGETAMTNWTSAEVEVEDLDDWSSDPDFYSLGENESSQTTTDTIRVKDVFISTTYQDTDAIE